MPFMTFHYSSQNMTEVFTTREKNPPFGDSVSFTERAVREVKECHFLIQEVPV